MIITIIIIHLFYLNCTSGAAPQQEDRALDRVPDNLCLDLFILICLNCTTGSVPHISSCSTRQGTMLSFILSLLLIYVNCASGTASQQGVAAPDRAPDFFQYVNCNLFKLCVRFPSTARAESQRQTAHQTINFKFVSIYLNCTSGAAPQQNVAAPDGAPNNLFYQINLF